MAEFKELASLSKAFKIFFVALSVVAVAALIGTFALMNWADDKVETANLTFNGVDLGDKSAKADENAYKARVHFPRLDFLLRSKVIAYIDIASISWASPIDESAVSALKSQNRHLKFITSQNLSALNIQNLGEIKYKMDFNPLLKTIVKYYVIIALVAYLGFILYKMFGGYIIEFLRQNSLPQAIYQGYKAINPLYRHTFWIVFIALNLVFGFHTVQFLWGNHDWGAVYGQLGLFGDMWAGRYTELLTSFFIQNNTILPIFNNILAFAGLTFAAVWLCIYLNIQKKLFIWVIVGFLLTLSPFTFSRLYYTYQVAGLFIALAIGILGFVLAKKAGEYNTNTLATNGGGGELLPILSHK